MQPAEEVATKVENTITAARSLESPFVSIKAIIKLKNGGLLVELDSGEHATWIKRAENQTKFVAALENAAKIKERSYQILTLFLPISSLIHDLEWLRAVEMENDIDDESIESIRWVKPVERRSPTQCVAHAIINLRTPQAANSLMKNGLYICKNKLLPRKEKREPV
ncbi:hypothetical protein BU15DRAFT_46065 [Melanogaster broomeanus]|nr:hypothetical protein BU15DRAFT_46065 [Melanogaster broomeanus]